MPSDKIVLCTLHLSRQSELELKVSGWLILCPPANPKDQVDFIRPKRRLKKKTIFLDPRSQRFLLFYFFSVSHVINRINAISPIKNQPSKYWRICWSLSNKLLIKKRQIISIAAMIPIKTLFLFILWFFILIFMGMVFLGEANRKYQPLKVVRLYTHIGY